MALSDEQNAMLRLLASGEQGYGDIAALMGLSEEEVRAKVVGALAQLQAEDKPAPNIPPPLAGGAKPAAEVAPPEPAPEPPPAEAEPPAEPIIAEPTAPRAAAQKPATTTPAAPPPTGPPPHGGRTITMSSGRNAWLLGGGALAVIVVIVVVILLTSGGGSGSSTTSTVAGSTTAAAEGKAESGSGGKEATQAELTAVDGSEAAGLATFGRVKNKLALQIEATGLEPTTEGTDAYTIWLAQSPQKMLPLASTGVKAGGKGAHEIAAEFEVPVEVLAYLAKGTFDQIAITRTRTGPLEAALKVATKKKTTPAYTGEAILRGTI
ncbi:MAG TPA: hypothetical protein VHV53_09900, partial [Solirubrobacterales bacterium]|nr:hypothetical protein [Solirubrobacterales bacterium]